MRFLMSFLAAMALFFTSPLALADALADQTDPALDALFLELRDGSVIDADETTNRIVEIWAQSVSPTASLLYQRAELAYDNGDLDLAQILLTHATGLAPNFAQGWALSGMVARQQGDPERALRAYDKVLALEPRHFIVRLQLADMLLSSGEDRAAYDMLQEVLKWNPHLDSAREQAARLRNRLSGEAI
jgi:predicted Zn-dependent protease